MNRETAASGMEKFVETLAFILAFSPRGEGTAVARLRFCEYLTGKSSRRISSETANDSPSLFLAHRMGEGSRRLGEGLPEIILGA